jgi:hypothetical protein
MLYIVADLARSIAPWGASRRAGEPDARRAGERRGGDGAFGRLVLQSVGALARRCSRRGVLASRVARDLQSRTARDCVWRKLAAVGPARAIRFRTHDVSHRLCSAPVGLSRV